MMNRPIRVLVAKVGLDGHDRGAKIIAAALRDAGMEVIYTGLRQTPEMVVNTALQEDVDAIGISILSGAHNTVFPKVIELMKEKGMNDVLLTGGGIIPEADALILKDNLLLFFTGYSRSASAILKDQNEKSKQQDKAMLENLHITKELGRQSLAELEAGNLDEFAHLMDIHWQRKKSRTPGMSNTQINDWYECAMSNGALGGKLIGVHA